MGLPAVKRFRAIGILSGLVAATTFADPLSTTTVAKTASGVVRDEAGIPAAGAEVWLCLNGTAIPSGPATLLAETKSDDQGRFSVSADVPVDPNHPVNPIVYLLARDAKQRLTWRILGPADAPWPDGTDLTVTPCVNWTAMIVSDAGGPAANVPVQVSDLFVKPGKNKSEVRIVLPPEIQSKLLVTSDDTGLAMSTTQVPADNVRVRLEVVGFTIGRSIRPGWKPAQFRVPPLGSVTGKVTGIAEREHLARARVRCTAAPAEGEQEAIFSHGGETDANVQPDGTFRIDGLRAGKYRFHLISAPPPRPLSISFAEHVADFPYYSERSSVVEVKAFQSVAGAEVTAIKAARVRGQVVDEESGVGIPNLKLQLWSNVDGRYSDYFSRQREVVTDKDGKFVSYIPPGSVTLSIPQTPPEYLPREWSFGGEEIRAEQGGDIEYPLVRLRRAGQITLRIVGDDGAAIANAQVQVDPPGRFSNEASNAAGEVSLKGLDPSQILVVRARHEQLAHGSPIKIDPSKQEEPIEIRVSVKGALTIVGKVLNDAGRPVPRAAIQCHHRKRDESEAFSYPAIDVLDRRTTDENGIFRIEGLWPFDRYCVEVSAGKHSGYCTTWVEGSPGQTLELPPIVLYESRSEVGGIVVDSAGQPVADVAVFNANDCARPVSTKTNRSGRFRLTGLFRGTSLLFAKKAGYQLGFENVESGSIDGRLTLFRVDEPAPEIRLEGPSPELIAQRRELAQWIVGELLAKYDQAGVLVSPDVLRHLALVDPEEAVARSTLLDETAAHWFRMELVPSISRRLSETAMDLVRQLPPEMAPRAALNAAIRLIDDQPDQALRFAEEALTAARSLDAAQRAGVLAEVSALYVYLGINDQGGRLAAQAGEILTDLEKSDATKEVRCLAALALMRFDAHRAAELVPEKEAGEDRGPVPLRLSLLLGRLSVDELLRDAGNGGNPRKVFELVRAKAPEPAEALGLAMAITDDSLRFQALLILMKAAAKRDPQFAAMLFDECVSITQRHLNAEPFAFDFGDGAGASDLLLFACRERIGFFDKLVPLVQSQPFAAAGQTHGRGMADMGYRAAARLSLVDIPSARRLFATARRYGSPSFSEEYEFGQGDELIALALLEPAEAKRSIETFLAKHKILVGMEGGQDGGLAWLASLLAVPPEETAEILRQQRNHYDFDSEPQLEILLRPCP